MAGEAGVPLEPGLNTLVLKIVNTGGPSGYYFRAKRAEDVLAPDLVAALVPGELLGETQAKRLKEKYRVAQATAVTSEGLTDENSSPAVDS